MKANFNLARPAVAAIALAAALGVTSAHAADVIMEEPPAPAAPVEMAPAVTWAGPYLGLYAGYGFAGEADSVRGTLDTDGFLGGAFAGIQGQNGAFVYGLEGDFGYSDVSAVGLGGTDASRNGLEGSLRGRLGYAMTDRVLLYGTAGGAATQMTYHTPGVKDENTMLGWTAGAGVDALLTDTVFARVEYRYTDFGSSTFNTAGGPTSIDSNDHRVTFGVGMKF